MLRIRLTARTLPLILTTALLPALLPACTIVQIDGALFFAAANYVGEKLRVLFGSNPEQKHLLILARTVTFVDTVGAEVIAREHRRRLAIGGGVYFHQLSAQARAAASSKRLARRIFTAPRAT